jgi:hypothetical protein
MAEYLLKMDDELYRALKIMAAEKWHDHQRNHAGGPEGLCEEGKPYPGKGLALPPSRLLIMARCRAIRSASSEGSRNCSKAM